MALITTRRMQINDIDAAGIAFTGRLVAMAIETMEEGLARHGMDFAVILRQGRYGFPIVHVDADFKRPFRHGDLVDAHLLCEEIGNRSYTLRIELRPAGSDAVSAGVRLTVVVVDAAGFASVAVPEEFRAVLERLRAP